jgi:hypothetical protein
LTAAEGPWAASAFACSAAQESDTANPPSQRPAVNNAHTAADNAKIEITPLFFPELINAAIKYPLQLFT